jgi:hypothetical protein
MSAAGAPPELVAADVLRPHWPHLVEWLSRRASEGLPPPPGIDPAQTYSLWNLRNLRARKGVNVLES